MLKNNEKLSESMEGTTVIVGGKGVAFSCSAGGGGGSVNGAWVLLVPTGQDIGIGSGGGASLGILDLSSQELRKLIGPLGGEHQTLPADIGQVEKHDVATGKGVVHDLPSAADFDWRHAVRAVCSAKRLGARLRKFGDQLAQLFRRKGAVDGK